MINRYTHRNLVWVDLESPTSEEIRGIMEEFSLHPLVGEGLMLPTARPEAEKFTDHLYLVLHFPAYRRSEKRTVEQEIDFVIGKHYIITARYESVDQLHEFSKIFETESLVNKTNIGTHAGFIFFHMLRHLYRAVAEDTAVLTEMLHEIEERIFRGEERQMVVEISRVARSALGARRILKAHTAILTSLIPASAELYGPSFAHYAEALAGEHSRLMNDVESYADAVTEMRETNNSLVSTKENEIMKNLTMMAFVTFPLSLFAAVLALEADGTPLIKSPNSFWVIVGLMIMATGVFLAYFRFKKWL